MITGIGGGLNFSGYIANNENVALFTWFEICFIAMELSILSKPYSQILIRLYLFESSTICKISIMTMVIPIYKELF